MATRSEAAMNLRGFPRELMRRLRIRALEEERTMAKIVAELVERYLEDRKRR